MADNLQIGIKIKADTGNASAQISSLNSSIDKLSDSSDKGSKKASEGYAAMSRGMKELNSSVIATRESFNRMIAVGAGITLAKALIQTSDAFSGLNARIKLVSGTMQEYSTAMSQVYEISQRNNVALADSAKLYTRLAPIAQDLGRSQQDVMNILAGVSASLKVSGASAAEASSTITQLTQALASQTVQWSDFGQLLDTNPALVRAVSKELSGVIQRFGSLKDAMSQGGVSNQELFAAIVKVSSGFEEQASKILTVSGAMTQLSNSWIKYIGEGDQANQTSRNLAEGISMISRNMDTLLFIPAKIVQGWGQVLEILSKVKLQMGLLSEYEKRDLVNRAITPEELGARRVARNAPAAAAADTSGTPYFDGVARGVASSSSRIITEASKRLGERENGAGSGDLVKFLNEHSGTVFSNLTVPWCARYVSAVLDSSGVGGLKTARAKDYLGFGESVWKQGQGNSALENVKPGDIAIFTRSGGGGHVGFVKAADPSRGTLDVLGGNQSDSVSVSHRSTAGLLAIRRATGKASDLDSAQKAMKDEADSWKKAQDDLYRQYADRLDRQGKLADARDATEKAKRSAQIEQIQAAAEKADKASTITIKTALDAQGIEAANRAIDAAEKKQADYLRQANAAASGSAEVQAAQREIAAIDDKIKRAKQYGQDEAGLLNERAIAEENLKQVRIKAGEGELSLQKALAENHAKYDALRKSANEDELKYHEARQGYENQLNQATAEGQKQAIDAALQRYQLATAAREIERQQLLAGKSGAQYAEQQIANEKAAQLDQVNLIDAERQATQQKLVIDQQVLQVQAEALQKQLAATTDREKQLELSRQLSQANASIAANAGQQQMAGYSAAGKIGQIYSDAAAKHDTANIQQVEEAQLRLNQAMQESVQQAQLAAQHMTDAFGKTGASIGGLVTSVAQFSQQMMQVSRDAAAAIEDLHKKGTYSPEKAYAVQDAAAKKSMQYQVALFGSLTAAASGFFSHTSKGYKAMQTAAQVFRAIEMGLAMQSAVLQIGQMVATMAMDKAQTVSSVANSGQRAAVKGAEAVVNQGAQGDPYSAIPRMIAMGAMVATILGGVGMAVAGAVGGGGGVTPPNPEDIQKSAGTGSVLGDASAQSQSISESLSLLADNSTADLSYSAGMLAALQSIDAGMKGLSVSVYAGIKEPTLSARQLKSGKSIVDYGILGDTQTVASLLSKGLSGQVYNDLQKMSTGGGMMGGGTSTVQWVKEFTGALPKNIADQFGRVMGSVVSSLGLAAGGLGMGGELSKAVGSTKVNVGRISLKGLSASQINDEISAVVGSIGDLLARKTIPGLKDFQKAGEGYYQTVIRVVEGTQRAGGELDQLGLKAISFKDILNKQGDVATEIIRQTVAAQAGLGAGVKDYLRTVTGSAADLITTAKNLREALDALRTGGFNGDFTTETVNASGGLSNFLSNLQTFNDKFTPSTDKLLGSWQSMADSFTRLGLKMPTSADGFSQLVHGIDQNTAAGRKLFAQVLALSGGFSDLMDSTKAVTDAVTTAQANLKSAYDAQVQTLQKVIDGVKSAQSTLSSAYTAQKNTLQQAAQAAKTYAQSLKDFIASMQGGSNAIGSPVDQYAALKSQFEQTLTAAQGGDESAKGKLQQAAQALLDFNKTWAGGTTQQAEDFSRIQAALTTLATQSDTAASVAGQQLSLLDQTVSKLIDINSSTISVEQAISELQTAQTAASVAQQQLDALTTQVGALIDLKSSTDAVAIGMKAVQDAIAAYLAAVQNQSKANAGVAQTVTTQQAGTSSVSAVNAGNTSAAAVAQEAANAQKYQAERTAAAAKFTHDINWWYRQVNADRNAGASAKKIQADADTAMMLIQQAYASPYNLLVTQTLGKGTGWVGDDRYVVTARARGGYTPAGYTLVGEEGPELVRFDRPSQILTARQTQEALSGGDHAELLAELKAIHAESRAQVTVLSQALPVVIDRLDGVNDRVDRIERTYKLRGAMA